jgi:predicted unusual protein kinase regulating ubiquinone biosynthesis (AarF/ABC1/UbiB family)
MAADSDSSGKLPPQGRLTRLRKLAGLSAQLGAEALKSGARRLAGEEPELLSRSAAEKLVATLGELKGAAMKLGQAVSMDPDLLPPEVRQVVARLQNQAPPMSYAQVTRVVEEELGAPPEQLFTHFSREPLAAASLGQVHRATLEDGRPVAVKVQYPGIAQSMASDLENVSLVVKAMSRTSKLMDGTAYFKELREELLLELDYRREAELCAEFALTVERLPELRVPHPVPERTARRVLTLELLEGPTLEKWLAAEPSNEERYRVARQLVLSTFGPFFGHGRIHADPHPGNYLVLPDGRLGLLDFGSIKQFSSRFVEANRRMFRQALQREPMDLVALVREVGFEVELEETEASSFLSELVHIAGRPVRDNHYDFSACTVNRDMRQLFARNTGRFLKIRPPAEAVMFFRATGGLTQNLQRVGARGDFRRVYHEVAELG